MECDICSSQFSAEPGLSCSACARSALYPLRIEHAKILLSKEMLGRQVQAIVAAPAVKLSAKDTAAAGKVEVQESSKQFQHESIVTEIVESRERIERIIRQSEILKERVNDYQKMINEKKATAKQRRCDLESAAATLEKLRPDTLNPIKKVIRKINHRHDSVRNHLISARVYLCAEGANLAGLQQCRRKSVGDGILESYSISGTPAMDLRDLNNYTASEISAALINVSNLLSLTCYYLGIRLPAELIIPDEHRPHASMNQPTCSYMYVRSPPYDPEFIPRIPDDTTAWGQNESPSRPRPLFIEQKLVLLAREDPNQYSLFVEGVSLLAWNIAWLCRTQGLPVASEDWEEVCAVGRNMWLLLVRAPKDHEVSQKERRTASNRQAVRPSQSSAQTKQMDSPEQNRDEVQQESGPPLGVLSHSTAQGFMRAAFSSSLIASSSSISAWKYASPVRVRDKLKAFLLAEMSGLDWEMLDEGEYNEAEGTANEETISSGSRKTDLHRTVKTDTEPGVALGSTPREGGMSTSARDTDSSAPSMGEGKAKGTSGWTKLKSRTTS